MMIKITQCCSMGCSHCMNNAVKCDKHMPMNIFMDALSFCVHNGCGMCLITGGEPTEHPHFTELLEKALEYPGIIQVTVTTNGVWLQEKYDYAKALSEKYPRNKMVWQVTSDERFYPTQIDLNNPVFHLPSMTICTQIERVYPQGRAKTNNLPYQAKGSKCFNVRAITHQLIMKQTIMPYPKAVTVRDVCMGMMQNGFFCTPDIGVNGEIRLGESDLCPVCSHISYPDDKIIQDILNFRCKQCEFINKNLPPMYRALIGEE